MWFNKKEVKKPTPVGDVVYILNKIIYCEEEIKKLDKHRDELCPVLNTGDFKTVAYPEAIYHNPAVAQAINDKIFEYKKLIRKLKSQ